MQSQSGHSSASTSLSAVLSFLRSLALLAAWALLASACGAEEAKLAAAQHRWKEAKLERYDLLLSVSCECQGWGQAVLQVREGTMTRAWQRGTGQELTAEQLWGPKTVDELFALLEKASREAHDWSADYDAVTGAPTRISIDWNEKTIDDEVSYLSGIVATLHEAKSRWAEAKLDDYRFRFERSCLCAERGPLVVTVEDGKVVEVKNEKTGALIVPEDYERHGLLTVDELFSVLERAATEAQSWWATYEPVLGYPTEIFLDWSRTVADDEIGYRLQLLVP